MIIRKLAEALRRQDWDTVLVELLIVVVGIFLGIEAANWNEDRRDRQDETAYLLRLQLDVRTSIDELRRGRDDVDHWNSLGRRALEALQNQDRTLTDEELGFALAASTRIGLPTTQLATIAELISSGRLNEISDPDIRAELVRMDGNIQGLNEHILILVDYATPVAPIVQMALRTSPLPDLPELSAEQLDQSVTYNFDALAADEPFQNALGYSLRLQVWNIFWMDLMIDDLKVFEASLAEKLENGVATEPSEP